MLLQDGELEDIINEVDDRNNIEEILKRAYVLVASKLKTMATKSDSEVLKNLLSNRPELRRMRNEGLIKDLPQWLQEKLYIYLKLSSDEDSPDENSSDEDSPDENPSDEKSPDENSSDEDSPDENSSNEDSPDENSSDEDSPDENPSDENSSDEDSPDENSSNEDSPDENSSDEDSPDENSSDEKSPDENSSDEDSSDDDSSNEDSSESEDEISTLYNNLPGEKYVIGFKDDCFRLLSEFSKSKNQNFRDFAEVWKKMGFSAISILYDLHEEAGVEDHGEFLNHAVPEMFLIAKTFMLPEYPKSYRKGALYLLYALYYKQPINTDDALVE
ncbi:nucleolin 2-like isoform X2 [Nilaparvata lugens]|uniref:nucleolin 2-like isoform X1 n=1 Tax=Nilaparvata lugens TaxID=108931 RepID=UPI00193E72B4|nr:nucleolin 2-like isoform X1 [Nilaparvata lugens]XP_039298832.1 nucleolin 2-like isoform X2 [Nilaparvata lugens]